LLNSASIVYCPNWPYKLWLLGYAIPTLAIRSAMYCNQAQGLGKHR
jgi:hypothetical protein